jgi:CRISPR-associated exonuclease Cas4
LSYRHESYVTRILYEKVTGEQVNRLSELQDPRVVYVTDLVLCTHKFHLKKTYPWLSITFDPAAVLGTIAHLGLGQLLREKGAEVEVEVLREVTVDGTTYTVKGRVDALDKTSGIVVEIKTARSPISTPQQHHIKQLNIYLNMLNYERGVLVYITPTRIVEFSVTREPVSIESEIRDLIENKYHPRYSWECSYCNYSKLCPYYTPTT